MKKIILEVKAEHSKKMLEVFGEIMEKQSIKLNPIGSKDGKFCVEISA